MTALDHAGRFADNGGTGYVLKPAYMVQPVTTFSPFDVQPVRMRLELRIISGHFLPKPNLATKGVRVCGVAVCVGHHVMQAR